MATENSSPAGSPPSAEVVGNAFANQYYHVLQHSPELAHRFYQEGSRMGRPENQGGMSLVCGLEEINSKILSMGYSEFTAAIKTVDAQESLDGGVTVLVTGHFTSKDNVSRSFTQSFFLATQEKGYYVLNDIFRYVDMEDHTEDLAGVNGPVTPLMHEEEPPLVHEQCAIPVEESLLEVEEEVHEEEEEVGEEEVYNPPTIEDNSIVEEVSVAEVIDEVLQNSSVAVAELSSASVQEEAPKMSYASIVKVMKENAVPLLVPKLAPARPVTLNLERQVAPNPTPATAPESAADSSAVESNSTQETEADSYSIYLRNLPFNATYQQLEEEFKRFGAIKADGIQIISNKHQGFCFGFVEFEVASAVQIAIEASPITIGGRRAYIEEKKTTGPRVGSQGRFQTDRGSGHRNDGLRSRGGYSGGRGFARGHYGNRTDFVSRGGGRSGPSSHGGDVGYQRVDSGGRGNRAGLMTDNPTSRNVVPRVPASA